MDENINEFEKRIRFEAEIGKDVQHIRDDFNNHIENEKEYKKKFDKVQESHNNILNRINNVEDDILDLEENNKRINTIDKDVFKHKIAILIIFIIILVLFLTNNNEIIRSFIQNILKIYLRIF